MKQKKYLVLKKYNRYREGDIVELNKNTAANMLKRGACEEYLEPKKEPSKKKATPKKDK
jgi:hypothetical protein